MKEFRQGYLEPVVKEARVCRNGQSGNKNFRCRHVPAYIKVIVYFSKTYFA